MAKTDLILPNDKKFISRNVYRPIAEERITLPLGLRSVGHCIARKGWSDFPRAKTFIQIFWVVSGEMEVIVKGKKKTVAENETFYFLPGQVHLLNSLSDILDYRWVTIDGKTAEQYISGFGLNQSIVNAGPCPESEFELLETEILDGTQYGQAKCLEHAFSLIFKIFGIRKINKHSRLVEECRKLIEKNLHNNDFNINVMAKTLKTHRSVLSKQFKEELGYSPIEYLVSKRTQKGLTLLEDTNLPIKEISALCGYKQPDYFAKAIRKMTGLNPLEIRNKNM